MATFVFSLRTNPRRLRRTSLSLSPRQFRSARLCPSLSPPGCLLGWPSSTGSHLFLSLPPPSSIYPFLHPLGGSSSRKPSHEFDCFLARVLWGLIWLDLASESGRYRRCLLCFTPICFSFTPSKQSATRSPTSVKSFRASLMATCKIKGFFGTLPIWKRGNTKYAIF